MFNCNEVELTRCAARVGWGWGGVGGGGGAL